MFRKTSKKGFSLVELLVVITIIAIMSVAAYTAVGGQTVKAKNSRRMQDISSIQQALEVYNVEKGAYPSEMAVPGRNTKTFSSTELTKQYISKAPTDPWSTKTIAVPYAYGVSANKKGYQLATVIEAEAELETDKAYVVGNGTDLINVAVLPATTYVIDGGATLPYNKP